MSELRRLTGLTGGVASTADLVRAGFTERRIAAAVDRGEIERLRRGVYCDPRLATELKGAVRVGGRLTCVSAARLHGLRVLSPPSDLHVEVPSNSARLRHPATGLPLSLPNSAVRMHWELETRTGGAIVSVSRCLEHVLDCLPALEALCILDSARERVEWRPDRPQLLEDGAFRDLLARVSIRARLVAERSITGSQAVGETVARERLAAAGMPVRAQVPLVGGYSADLLIGDRLVFEVDGEGPHSGPGSFDRDRSRWAWLKSVGYVHLSFSHRQVLECWEEVFDAIRMHVRRGDHWWANGNQPAWRIQDEPVARR
ncbi:type IV toxin-antitoxin system AbiEi family antitoxin domain-containing protein [Agromyces sp. NPDC058110]|uniref:type IV toxin-antitoxin system AbiEi family antitoxin domain-containing protein n=1 Tax=Agromyces sp. NPDC058110 TaxID=3346345 RepID=UPI0036D7C512